MMQIESQCTLHQLILLLSHCVLVIAIGLRQFLWCLILVHLSSQLSTSTCWLLRRICRLTSIFRIPWMARQSFRCAHLHMHIYSWLLLVLMLLTGSPTVSACVSIRLLSVALTCGTRTVTFFIVVQMEVLCWSLTCVQLNHREFLMKLLNSTRQSVSLRHSELLCRRLCCRHTALRGTILNDAHHTLTLTVFRARTATETVRILLLHLLHIVVLLWVSALLNSLSSA